VDNKIITIGRQFGSGGSEIGKKLAEELNISYYDKEIIAHAAKDSCLCPEVFEKVDEKESSGLPYAFSMGVSPFGMYVPCDDILSNERLFKLQSDAIYKIAERESCIIIGRCSDYILRDFPKCLNFFIHNSTENRIKLIMHRENVSESKAMKLITKTDKSRAAYYNYYTNKQWGFAASYNASIDVSVLGIDDSVLFIKDFVQKFEAKF